MTTEMDKVIESFISKTAKSKVAVVVPLYGYWADVKDNPLTAQVLKIVMDRINTSVHQLYIFYVAEGARVPKDVQNFIVTQKASGNIAAVDMEANSNYADYLRKGLEVAHDTTEAAYFIVINPWVLVQSIGVDMIVDRLNYSDSAKIVSGYDLRPTSDPEKFDPLAFEQYFIQTPKESKNFDVNFFGITRYAYEMFTQDPKIRTSKYFGFDWWQNMYAKGYDVITSQRIPIFVFDANLMGIENMSDVEADKAYFVKKWGFTPEV